MRPNLVATWKKQALGQMSAVYAGATPGPQWGLSWTYDGFGNRLSQNVTKGTGPVVSLSISAATNRITTEGFAYDAAGHMTQWPGGTVTLGADYDVEGRLSVVKQDGVQIWLYLYDARNRRVRKSSMSGTMPTYEVYGLRGELLGVYGWYWPQGAPSPVFRVEEERIYFAGRVATRLDETGSPNFGRMDRLGSVKAWQRYPFGEGNESNTYDEYATYPIDRWTGHYYAWNRFYSATWGRFSSPDPYVMSGGLTHPQGWNRYSYVGNDPVNYYDPKGLHRRAPYCEWVNHNVRIEDDEFYLLHVYDSELICEEQGSPNDTAFVEPYDVLYPKCNHNKSQQEDRNLASLVDNLGAAARLTEAIGVPPDWILSWAAAKSGWGQSNIARRNGNFFGLREGSNWINQAACPTDAVPRWACFDSFEVSASSALLSVRKEPPTGILWTAAGVLTNARINGESISVAFQQVANLGHDAGNLSYGMKIEETMNGIVKRLDCLRKGGYLEQ